jgi:hypothetical protein
MKFVRNQDFSLKNSGWLNYRATGQGMRLSLRFLKHDTMTRLAYGSVKCFQFKNNGGADIIH